LVAEVCLITLPQQVYIGYKPPLISHINYTDSSRQGMILPLQQEPRLSDRDSLSHAGFILYRHSHE